MSHMVCPAWLGYFLLNPLRRLLENPERMLRGLIIEGMTVLEPGCGMGYFTLPMARMVGPGGKVVAVDIQPKMLSALRRRAEKAGLSSRVEARLAGPDHLALQDLEGQVDVAVALHVVHEVPDPSAFFLEIRKALRPGARFFLAEPRGHVSRKKMEETLSTAEAAGYVTEKAFKIPSARCALLKKSGAHPG